MILGWFYLIAAVLMGICGLAKLAAHYDGTTFWYNVKLIVIYGGCGIVALAVFLWLIFSGLMILDPLGLLK